VTFIIFIRLKARLQRHSGFTLWRVLAVFMCSAITPTNVNQFGWNLEHSEDSVGAWPWQILGAIRAVAIAGEPGKFFGQVSNARFHGFPVGQISRNVNTTRRSVSRWRLLKQNFENLTKRGHVFTKKLNNFSKF